MGRPSAPAVSAAPPADRIPEHVVLPAEAVGTDLSDVIPVLPEESGGGQTYDVAEFYQADHGSLALPVYALNSDLEDDLELPEDVDVDAGPPEGLPMIPFEKFAGHLPDDEDDPLEDHDPFAHIPF